MAADQRTGPLSDAEAAAESPACRNTRPRLVALAARQMAWLRGKGAWIRVAVSAALILVLLQQTSLTEIGAALNQTLDRWPLVLVAACLPGVGILIAASRWQVLLGGISVRPGLLALARAMLVGAFFNYFLPSTIGGDVARSWWIQQALGSKTLSLTVVGLDRFIGLVAICAVGLIAAALQPSLVGGLPHVWVVPLLISLAALFALLLGRISGAGAFRWVFSHPLWRAVRDKMAVVRHGLLALRRSKGRLFAAFALSIALQVEIIILYIVIAAAAGIEISPWALAVLIPVVTLVTLLPITINGIGLREGSLALLGATFGLTTGDAVVLAWLFVASQFTYVLAGGLIYMNGRSRSQRKEAALLHSR